MNKEDTIKVINNDEIKDGHLPEQSESQDDENQVLANFFIKQRNGERKRKVCKIIIIVSILIVLLVMLILHINKENEKREKLERWYYSFWLNGFEYTYWLHNYSIESVREKMELHKAEIEEASEPWFRGGIGELLLNPYNSNPEVEKWSEEEYEKHRKEINAALWKDVAGKFLPIYDYPETQKEQKIRIKKSQEAQAAIELLILGDEATQTEYNSLLDIPPDVFHTAIVLIEFYGVRSQDDAFLAKVNELKKLGVDIHQRSVETFWIGYVH